MATVAQGAAGAGGASGMRIRLEAVAERIAAALREEAPELKVTVVGEDVIIEGWALLYDPRLRWIAGLLK